MRLDVALNFCQVVIWTFRFQVVNYLCQQGVSHSFCGRNGPLSHLVYWQMKPSTILDSDANTFGRRAKMLRYVFEFCYLKFWCKTYLLYNMNIVLVVFLNKRELLFCRALLLSGWRPTGTLSEARRKYLISSWEGNELFSFIDCATTPQVKSLLTHTRDTIRECLSPGVLQNVEHLPIPRKLKEIIVLSEING